MWLLRNFSLALASCLASSALQLTEGAPVNKRHLDANFQYAIAFHNETECEECLRENITAENNGSWKYSLIKFMKHDFLKMNVDVLDKTANCTEKPHLMLLSIKLRHGSKTPTKEEVETKKLHISRVLECTGHLSPGETFHYCFDPILNSVTMGPATTPEPTQATADIGKELITYIPTVLLVLFLVALPLAVIVKKRRVLGPTLVKIMRNMVWGTPPERVPLLVNRQPQPPREEEVSRDNDPFNIAEWARHMLDRPFIGPRWANPVARVPVQRQNSDSESTASSPSRLFDALIESPPFPRRRVSPDGSGHCSLDYQRCYNH